VKRIAILLLALLLLFACGRVAPEPVTETTTEIITTTEEETSTQAPVADEPVRWRILDVNADEGREAQEWLAEQYEQRTEERPTEFPMGKDKTIVAHNKEKIILRDDKTGKEAVLLDTTYLGDATTPEEALLHETAWKGPVFAQALDDRYFAYYWIGWEWAGGTGIYDTQNMREIPIEWDESYNYTRDENWRKWSHRFVFLQICGSSLYLADASYGGYDGTPHLMRADLKALDTLKSGEPLMAKDVLKDIPSVKDTQLMNYRIVTDDERYFLMNDIDGLRIYDLRQKKLALQLTPAVFGPGAEESDWITSYLVPRDNKLYWTDRPYKTDLAGYSKFLAEITLP